MSSQIIEHVVLFKVKDNTDPSKVNEWINALNGLISLDQVVHLSAGPVLATKSPSTNLHFTHILHSRYNSKADLNAYSAHPSHVSVVRDVGQPIVEDIMAVDWIVDDLHGPLGPQPWSAIRVTLFKLKEDLGDHVKSEILRGIEEIKDSFGQVCQFSCGENFSAGRDKGFSLAWLAVFPGVTELEKANEQVVNIKEKFKDYLESELVTDYVV